MKKDWNPQKYIAKCCGDLIWSKVPGRLCSCKCGEAFVDQNDFYDRASGNIELAPLEKAMQEGESDEV